MCGHRVPCPCSPVLALRPGQDQLSPPAPLGAECAPAGSARPCVRVPAPSGRAHAPRASAFAHFSRNGSAHARSTAVPLHSNAPPAPPPDDFTVSKPRGPPRPPAFYPGSRSTRRPAGECQAVRGRGRPRAAPRPGRRAPAAIGDKQRARSPGAALPARRPGIALPPPRARSSSKGGKKRRKK